MHVFRETESLHHRDIISQAIKERGCSLDHFVVVVGETSIDIET